MCVECLSEMFIKMEQHKSLHGIRIARRAPTISHLFFADDSFLFFRVDMLDCHSVKSALDAYEAASRQQINFNKSFLNFSLNTDPVLRSNISSFFHVQQDRGVGTYLGLPSVIGRKKLEVLRYIK